MLEGAKDDLQSWLWNHCPGQPIGFVRNRLARVLFQKDEVAKKVTNLSVKPIQEDLVIMKELLEAGKVIPVIDRQYAFDEVAEAIRYYGEGHARGKVVITLAHNNNTRPVFPR